MSLFSGFNIGGAINNISSSFSNTINQFSSGLNQGLQAAQGLINTASATISSNPILNTVGNIAGAVKAVDNIFDTFQSGASNLGSALRMTGNAAQGVFPNAQPAANQYVTATVVEDTRQSNAVNSNAGDWRVSLEVPSQISNSPILAPLVNSTANRMVFPFNPVIFFQQSANYNKVDLTHTNYPFLAYQNSEVNDITITGDFVVENEADAKYWIGSIHFLRTMTKMFYGNSSPQGNPPLLSRLNGYGKHVLNDIPVVISNFTVDLPSDVDYIPCTVEGQINYVPTQSTVTVTVTPTYSRRHHSRFNLNDFANGSFVGKSEGFV